MSFIIFVMFATINKVNKKINDQDIDNVDIDTR